MPGPISNDETLVAATAAQAPVHQTTEEIISLEFKNLDEIMSYKGEFRNVITQIYKIMTLLHRLGNREDKNYALDKELEMSAQIKVIKDGYNSWPVLVITCIAGGLTIAGGVVGIFGAFPGTAAGNLLAKIPGLGSFFDVSGAADQAKAASELASKITGFGSGVGSVGQGIGVVGKLFDNKDEAQRAVNQFWMQQLQRKHEDRTRSGNDEGQQTRDAMRNQAQIEAEAHNTATRLLETRS
jgi:hypothetical protein